MIQYRKISKIGSRTLKEPLEVSLTESIDRDNRFTACYILQGSYETDGKGIKGFGTTEEEAVNNLGELILIRYRLLRKKEYCLSGGGRIQLKNLRAIFI